MAERKAAARARDTFATRAEGGCPCGAVQFEIDVPAVWAWHDHSAASRAAHGAVSTVINGARPPEMAPPPHRINGD